MFDGVVFNQVMRISRRQYIAHVRPWIYLHGTLADGQFQLEVLDGATVLGTYQIDYTLLNGVKVNDYFHGYVRFDTDGLMLNVPEGQTNKEYTFRFTMQNHTTDSGNFLGIVRTWENKIGITYGDVDGNNQAVNDSVEPAGIELYVYRGI